MARDSIVCNVSVVGLWLGTGDGLARGSFVCNASVVGLWLGTGGDLWLGFICL